MTLHRIALALALLWICSASGQNPAERMLVLEPAADTSLFEEGELSNGAGIYLFTGTTALGSLRRALVRFDLSSLPNGAQITSATFSVTVSRTISSTLTVRLHRVTTAWGEGASDAPDQEGTGIDAEPGDATWTAAIVGQQDWLTPGGDYVADASASTRMRDLGQYEYASDALTEDVRAWFDGSLENNGWILVSNEGTGFTTAKRLDSRENPDAGARPRLTVTYTGGVQSAPVALPVGGFWLMLLFIAIAASARLRRTSLARKSTA